MLRVLRIRDLAIIDDVTIEFGPGLNLLTGETGAGKSILVDALGLVAGERADRGLVRAGAERAVVEALLELPDTADCLEWARLRGLDAAPRGEWVIRREVAAEGPGRVFLNGSPIATSLLRELGSRLLEVHGQHEQRSLCDPARQLALLDRFGGHAVVAQEVREACRALREARDGLAEVVAREGQRAERMERLAERRRELEALRPRAGEIAGLERERRVLRNAERVAACVAEAVERVYDGEPAAAGLAAIGARRVDELAGYDETIAPLAERLRAAVLELQDLGAALRDYRDGADFDPRRLDVVEARRTALEGACKRHQVDEAGLVALLARTVEELGALGSLERECADRERDVERAQRAYGAGAERLAGLRQAAAARLGPALLAQFKALALERARFEPRLVRSRADAPGQPDAWPLSPTGGQEVEFHFAANPGEPLAPLGQVASGGELSRVLLALHVVGGADGERRVMVFDEVDAGIGGAVADAVGARLSGLSREQQVLCVTHLPQVAAWAARHYRVQKRVSGGRTRAELAELDLGQRVEELARMLGGRRTTEASRRHAAELLATAGGDCGARREA